MRVRTHRERTSNELERAHVFLSKAIHTLDDKGRVVLPSAYRAELKDGLVTTQGKEGQIAVVPVDTFRADAEREMAKPRTRDARRRARAAFSAADQSKLDSQGRILLNADLRRYAGIEHATEVVVAGVFDHIEIWNTEAFLEEQAASDRKYREDEEGPGY